MLSKHPKRTAVIHVRMTEMERDMIVARATKTGRSVSDYVRRATMHVIQAGQAESPTQQPRALKSFGSSDGMGGA